PGIVMSTFFVLLSRLPPISTLFPYTTLFRSNNGLRLADNLQLAINVVAGNQGLIAFDEYHQGRAATRNQVLAYFSGTPIIWMLADRKSTRLNSSHSQTSYAVFCLKKKTNARG